MSISHNEVEILFVDIVIATMLQCPVRNAVEHMLLPGRGSQQVQRRWGHNKMTLKDQDLDLDTLS